MRIVEHIIPKCFDVFINDCGAYEANSSICILHISFRSGKNAKDNSETSKMPQKNRENKPVSRLCQYQQSFL
jgi:hypothetical protein